MSNPNNRLRSNESKDELESYLLREIVTEALAVLGMGGAAIDVETRHVGPYTLAHCIVTNNRPPHLKFRLSADRMTIEHDNKYTDVCRLYRPDYSELIQAAIVDFYRAK